MINLAPQITRMSLAGMMTALLLSSCGQDEGSVQQESLKTIEQVTLDAQPFTNRWYTQSQLAQGKAIYDKNCASCHGQNAESIPNWKQPDDLGNYPPPPLNGTAHAWHHPLSVLDMVIKEGGKPVGGVMPAWGDVLSFEQRMSVIASFQSYWSDEIYTMWLERERSSRSD
jgi:mono/diheme cytochrome c family protein